MWQDARNSWGPRRVQHLPETNSCEKDMGPGIYHVRLNYKDQARERDWTWERDCSEVKQNYPVGEMCKRRDAGCQWERTRMLSGVGNQQRQKGVTRKKTLQRERSTLKYRWTPLPPKKTQLIVTITQLPLNCTVQCLCCDDQASPISPLIHF